MAAETDLDIREMKTDIKWIRHQMENDHNEVNCLREDHEKTKERVSVLENWRYGIIACLALISLMIGWGWISPGF